MLSIIGRFIKLILKGRSQWG